MVTANIWREEFLSEYALPMLKTYEIGGATS